MRGKKDATTYSRQACFVNRFTLQGFKRECREYVVASFFPLIIFILLCFNVLSTVPRENRLANFLYIYIYITNCRQYCFGLLGLISAVLMLGWR